MFLFNSFFFFSLSPQHVCWKAGMSEEVDLHAFCLNWPFDYQWRSSSQGPQCPASGQPRWLPRLMAKFPPALLFFWKAVVQCPQALLEDPQGSQELSNLHHDIRPVTTSWSLRVTVSHLWTRRVLPESSSWCPMCWLLIQRPEHLVTMKIHWTHPRGPCKSTNRTPCAPTDVHIQGSVVRRDDFRVYWYKREQSAETLAPSGGKSMSLYLDQTECTCLCKYVPTAC